MYPSNHLIYVVTSSVKIAKLICFKMLFRLERDTKKSGISQSQSLSGY